MNFADAGVAKDAPGAEAQKPASKGV